MLSTLALTGSSPGSSQPVASALDHYASGDFDVGGRGLAALTVSSFEQQATRWLGAAGSGTERRAWVVATVALELAHIKTAASRGERGSLIAWACDVVRARFASRSPGAIEADWSAASIAGYEELELWSVLTGDGADERDGAVRDVLKAEGRHGHLAHALARFPGDVRLRLAAIEARDVKTLPWSGGRWRFADVDLPSTLERLAERARSKPSDPELIALSRYESVRANRQLSILSELPAIARDYAELEPTEVGAEALLRVGFVRLRERDWPAAIAAFTRARNRSHDDSIQYLTHLFSGVVHKRRGDHAAAIASFRASLEVFPRGWAASTLLAAELAGSDDPDDRAEAPGVLSAARRSTDGPDPWTRFGTGGAVRWKSAMARLRDSLSR